MKTKNNDRLTSYRNFKFKNYFFDIISIMIFGPLIKIMYFNDELN